MFSKPKQKIITSFLIVSGYLLVASGCVFAQTFQIPSLLGGQEQQKTSSVKLTASDFVLVWSANTYTPPAYQGKALPTYDSQVKVSVVPITKAGLSAPALLFRWSQNEIFDQYNSGENRVNYFFSVNAAAGSYQYIDVKILDKEEIELFTLSTSIPVVTSQIVVLQTDKQTPSSDISGNLSPLISFGQEGVFSALPYFFNIFSSDSLNYQWTFDNNSIAKTEEKNKFSIKAPESDSAEAFTKILSVSAVNPYNDIQRASNSIEITFSK